MREKPSRLSSSVLWETFSIPLMKAAISPLNAAAFGEIATQLNKLTFHMSGCSGEWQSPERWIYAPVCLLTTDCCLTFQHHVVWEMKMEMMWYSLQFMDRYYVIWVKQKFWHQTLGLVSFFQNWFFESSSSPLWDFDSWWHRHHALRRNVGPHCNFWKLLGLTKLHGKLVGTALPQQNLASKSETEDTLKILMMCRWYKWLLQAAVSMNYTWWMSYPGTTCEQASVCFHSQRESI